MNSTPWEETIKSAMKGRIFKRKIAFLATELDTGKIKVFNEQDFEAGEEYLTIAASSALPGLFRPTFYQDHTYVDGGVYSNIGLESIINRCLE